MPHQKLVSKTFGCSLAHSNKLLSHTHTHTYIPQTHKESLNYVQWLPMGQISVAVIYVHAYSKRYGSFKWSVQIYGTLLLFFTWSWQFSEKYHLYTVVSQGHSNLTCDFGLHGRTHAYPGAKIPYVCIEAATVAP